MIKKFKYMRLQVRENSYRTKKPAGVFTLNWRMIRKGAYSKEDEEAFYRINDWFKANLPEPPLYDNDNPKGAITYYKVSSFDKMQQPTKELLDLLDKYKVVYDIIFANNVGKIIYEDNYQVGIIDI